MKTTRFESVWPVRMAFDVLLEKGVPRIALESALGLNRAELDHEDLRIPARNNLRLLKRGIEYLGPSVVLELGASASPENIGIPGQIMRNCRNLREAIYQFLRYQRLSLPVSKMTLRNKADCVELVYTVDTDLSETEQRILTEIDFSICIALTRKLTGSDLIASEIRFSYAKPDHVEAYHRSFGSPLKFDQTENVVVTDPNIGNRPIPGSYRYMKGILVGYAEELMAELETGTSFQDHVKRLIVEKLPKGYLDIEQVSGRLNMSRWTLARKLKKEGTTFHKLVSDLRSRLAVGYLQKSNLSTTDIAFLLGYSESSAFQRAFKRWTGQTPKEFKRSIQPDSIPPDFDGD